MISSALWLTVSITLGTTLLAWLASIPCAVLRTGADRIALGLGVPPRNGSEGQPLHAYYHRASMVGAALAVGLGTGAALVLVGGVAPLTMGWSARAFVSLAAAIPAATITRRGPPFSLWAYPLVSTPPAIIAVLVSLLLARHG